MSRLVGRSADESTRRHKVNHVSVSHVDNGVKRILTFAFSLATSILILWRPGSIQEV